MVQGEDTQPGERRCPDCERRWYSAALLNDDEADCPACGARLSPDEALEADERA